MDLAEFGEISRCQSFIMTTIHEVIPMRKFELRLSNVALLSASVAALLLMQGCSAAMHDDDQASDEMSGGIAKTREGLDAVSEGIDDSEAGDKVAGMAHINSGLRMMSDGMNRMVGGMDRMPDGMMKGCCQGSDAMMAAMQQAMQQIRDGRDMVNDASADNDAAGVAKLQDGANAMTVTLDSAQESMRCMGHSSMSQMM